MSKKSEEDWEAESDVDTLIHAREILADDSRKERALTVAKKRNKATDETMKQLQSKTSKRLKKTFKGK